MVMLMLNVCETLLVNVKNRLLQNKRSNAELSDKLHGIFEDNLADYDKFASWYGKEHVPINVTERIKYEHYVIENFKKSVYGDSYAIKEYKSSYY